MSKETRSTLKGYFNTGDKPTEAQFASLIDSNLNLDDGGTVTASLSVAGNGTGSFSVSGSISHIQFENLPTTYAQAIPRGSGSLYRSGSTGDGNGSFLCLV